MSSRTRSADTTQLPLETAQAPLLPVFEQRQVNSYTPDTQGQPAIATLADGGFVIVWESEGQDGEFSDAIVGQRFDANGTLVGAEFLINSRTDGEQRDASVAAFADGGFIVVWETPSADEPWLRGQRYDAAGRRVGDEVLLTDAEADYQNPTVVALNDGGFYLFYDSTADGLVSRRFDLDGNPLGDELLLDDSSFTFTPMAVTLADGSFLVTYARENEGELVAQRFTADAAPAGEPIIIAPTFRGGQDSQSVSALPDGGFVATWIDRESGLGEAIFALRFDAAGAPIGDATQVNDDRNDQESDPRIVALTEGGFVVAWEENNRYFAREFDGLGAPVGEQFDLTTSEAGRFQNTVALAALPNNAYVAAFATEPEDVFDPSNLSYLVFGDPADFSVQAAPELSDLPAPLVFQEQDVNAAPQLLFGDASVTLTDADSPDFSGGVLRITYLTTPASLAGDFNAPDGPTQDQLSIRDQGDGDGEIGVAGNAITLGGVQFATIVRDGTDGSPLVVAFNDNADDGAVQALLRNLTYQNISDAPLPARSVRLEVLDGDGASSTPQVLEIQVIGEADGPVALVEEQRVNSFTDDRQTTPSVAVLNDGSYVITWFSREQEESIMGQRFDANGVLLGPEFQVARDADRFDLRTTTTALDDGGFLVAWADFSDRFPNPIFARRYAADGTPLTDAMGPTITVDGDEAFVVGLTQLADGTFAGVRELDRNDDVGVAVQRFDGELAPIGEVTVHPELVSNVRQTVGLLDGGFLLIYEDAGDVFGQRFDGTLSTVGDAFRINTETADTQINPVVARLEDGGIVVAWRSDGDQDGDDSGVFAQRYDADLAPVGEEFRVNATTQSDQSPEAIAALAGGGFAISYRTSDDPEDDLLIQQYDAAGRRIDDEYGITDVAARNAENGAIAGRADGGIVLTFSAASDVGDGSSFGIVQTILANPDTFPVQEAPEVSGLISEVTFEESAVNAGPQLLSPDSAVTVVDVDSTDFDGGYLSLTRVVLNDAATDFSDAFLPPDDRTQDVLGVRSVGDGAGEIRVVDDTVLFGGVAFGTLDLVGPELLVSFNGNASADAVAALIDNLTYANVSDAPLDLRRLRLVVSDGDGANSEPQVFDLRVNEEADGLQPVIVDDEAATLPDNGQEDPVATALSDGGYVLVYRSGVLGVVAQRFDANGQQEGAEVALEGVTNFFGSMPPSVTALADGGYLVAWADEDSPSDPRGIFVQRFDGRSNPVGDTTRVNSTVSGDQSNPNVVLLSSGELVVVWEGVDEVADIEGVFGQRIDAAGNLLGDEFQVALTGDSRAELPVVTALQDGGFVVVWSPFEDDGSQEGIFGQRYDGLANPVGNAFQINTRTEGVQTEPAVAALVDGGFIVTWQSESDAEGREGIYAQRFDGEGQPVATEFLVNDEGEGFSPDVAALPNGGWIIVWQEEERGERLFSQQYDGEGRRIDSSGAVNVATFDDANDPTVATLADGNAVIAYTVGSTLLQSVFADPNAFPATAAPEIADLDSTATLTESAVNAIPQLLDLDGDVTLTDADSASFAGGSVLVSPVISPPSVSDDFNAPDDQSQDVLGVRNQGDGDGQIGVIGTTVSFAGVVIGEIVGDGAQDRPLEVALTENASREAVEALLENLTYANPSSDPQPTRDYVVQVIDDQGNVSEPLTVTVALTASPDGLPPVADEQPVNTLTQNNQRAPAMAELADGTVVAVFESSAARGTINGQRLNQDGTPLGEEFVLSAFTFQTQANPDVAALADGGFVAVWDSSAIDGDEEGIVARRFDGDGNALGAEFIVNEITLGAQAGATVVALDDGAYAVTWDGEDGQVSARIYNSDGSARTGEFRVNGAENGGAPEITVLDDGELLIAWVARDSDDDGIFAQRFDSLGNRVGESFLLNEDEQNDQNLAGIATLENGHYVVLWRLDFDDVYGRVFDSQDRPVTGDFRISENFDSQSIRVEALATGGFAVAWSDQEEILLQQFDALGRRLDGTTTVNTQAEGVQNRPNLLATADGQLWVTWTSETTGQAGDGSGEGIFLRRYGNLAPTTEDIALGGEEDRSLAIELQQFIEAFSDGDNHALERIVIDTLPTDGTLLLGGEVIGAGDEITATALQTLGLRYVPADDFNGDDSFQWRGGDRYDLSSPSSVTLSLAPVNDVPVAAPDVAATDEATPVSGNVLTNDTDVDGDLLSIDGAGEFLSASGASVTLEEDGSFVYDPGQIFVDLAPGELAEDSFEYTVTDGNGAFATGEVSVQVSGLGDAPRVIRIGDAPPQITIDTLDAWREAWTDPGVAAAHRADLLDGSEPWTDLLYLPFASQALAGGDGFRGDIGVSGQTLATSAVSQEIDGTEALRFRLAEDATEVTFGIQRLFPNDDGQGRDEAGRVQLYSRTGELVGEAFFVASVGNGTLEVTVSSDTPFVQAVFTAGFQDGDSFVFGGYSPDGNTGTEQAPAGSDYLLDYLEFTLADGANAAERALPAAPEDAQATPLGLLGVQMEGIEPELG